MTTRRASGPAVERAVPLISVDSLRLAVAALLGFRKAIEAVADRLHRDGDAEARAWGWEVTRTRWGGRTYRDPRIAQLAAFRQTHPARAEAGDWPEEWRR